MGEAPNLKEITDQTFAAEKLFACKKVYCATGYNKTE